MAKFCGNCGTALSAGVKFCPSCGTPQIQPIQAAQYQPKSVVTRNQVTQGMKCPRCGGNNVAIQTIQENLGGQTVSKTKSVYKEKRHGILWWLFIGWWWWIIDLCLWIFLFIPRALIHAGRKKTYKGESTTISTTSNRIVYRTICTCQSCGNTWTQT